MRRIVRFFSSALAMAMAPSILQLPGGAEHTIEKRIDYRTARGRRSSLRRRNRSRYMPHQGGGQRPRPYQMTAGDRERLANAALKRDRRALRHDRGRVFVTGHLQASPMRAAVAA
jgi:hypothetical protein